MFFLYLLLSPVDQALHLFAYWWLVAAVVYLIVLIKEGEVSEGT